MKHILIKLLIVPFLFSFFIACSSDGEVRDYGVTAVQKLYEPDNGKTLQLEAKGSLTFKWEPALAEDGGNPLYEIAFDKADGDFSQPVAILAADQNGGVNRATLTHKQINKIYANAGIESGMEGTLKWTVLSSKGYQTVKAVQERTLTAIRLTGFTDIPEQLYITGKATEVGDNVANALIMKRINEGEFEIYTKLTEGETFHFVSSPTADAKSYSLGKVLIEEDGVSTAPKTGIYKYFLDFNTRSYSTKEVTKVSLFLCWSQMKIELPYKGLGVWELNDYTLTGLSGGENDDDRYKFRMESSEGETEWRSPGNDAKPSGNEAYYHMVEKDEIDQWSNGQIWKSPSTTGWSDKTYDFVFSLNPEKAYTHNLIIKK